MPTQRSSLLQFLCCVTFVSLCVCLSIAFFIVHKHIVLVTIILFVL